MFQRIMSISYPIFLSVVWKVRESVYLHKFWTDNSSMYRCTFSIMFIWMFNNINFARQTLQFKFNTWV